MFVSRLFAGGGGYGQDCCLWCVKEVRSSRGILMWVSEGRMEEKTCGWSITFIGSFYDIFLRRLSFLVFMPLWSCYFERPYFQNSGFPRQPTFWDPMNCTPPGSSVHGILQERILEWVPMPSSRGSCWPRDQTCFSYTFCKNWHAGSLHLPPPGNTEYH